MNVDLMFSSNKESWGTPKEFFNKLNSEFNFDLDPCANKENAKCKTFFTKDQDGLIQDWSGHSVFCNPPYTRSLIKWVKKCYDESKKPNTKVVMLVFARTDTKWFHEYVYHKAKEIRFLRGRIRFEGSSNAAPAPSMVVVF